MSWTLWIILALAALLLLGLLVRRLGFSGSRSGGKERERLLRMCFGNLEAVERLISLERQRDESISEKEACIRAAERLKRHKS
jgi:hypothetical protein